MRLRSLLLVPLLCTAAILGHSSPAAAHPLGNFTINHYAGITIGQAGISVRWVLDMAEIPAFAARRQIDADRDGSLDPAEIASWLDATLPGLLEELDLRVDGKRQSLAVVSREVTFPPGQGGLSTLRLVVELRVEPAPAAGSVTYRDGTYPERIGWHEIVVQAGPGSRLTSSDAPIRSVSDELRAYPADALTNPRNVTSASFQFDGDSGSGSPGAANAAPTSVAQARPGDLLASLAGGKLTIVGVRSRCSSPWVSGPLMRSRRATARRSWRRTSSAAGDRLRRRSGSASRLP